MWCITWNKIELSDRSRETSRGRRTEAKEKIAKNAKNPQCHSVCARIRGKLCNKLLYFHSPSIFHRANFSSHRRWIAPTNSPRIYTSGHTQTWTRVPVSAVSREESLVCLLLCLELHQFSRMAPILWQSTRSTRGGPQRAINEAPIYGGQLVLDCLLVAL